MSYLDSVVLLKLFFCFVILLPSVSAPRATRLQEKPILMRPSVALPPEGLRGGNLFRSKAARAIVTHPGRSPGYQVCGHIGSWRQNCLKRGPPYQSTATNAKNTPHCAQLDTKKNMCLVLESSCSTKTYFSIFLAHLGCISCNKR